ncbi:MAG: CPBP family intramembrane metalloprotease [Chlorobiaceae bacterium]|nr:CPBP family intramembrane metalloprotease [Chlorobiaceae bacterium]NTV61270.1 CPBP family intramembrane metalloprotease [Chlorobiaceae bacterium]
MLTTYDPFAGKRPSFIINTIILAVMMVLYLLSGQVLLFLLGKSGVDTAAIFTPESVRTMFPEILFSQGTAQLLLLALPVLFLAAFHTRTGNPFSGESLAFLGIGEVPDSRALFLAVAGIFLLQPLLHTITSLEELYLWPALGKAGAEVVRQQQQMDAFIKELARVRDLPGFFAVLLVLALLPAFCEELLFRGYIQKNYTRSVSPGNAVVLTGFAFAFFHLSPANLLPLALLGWFIGYIYAVSGNLAVSVFVHFVNNLAALLVLLFTGSNASVGVPHPERVVYSPWWWLLVVVSMVLFTLVVRRFSGICSASGAEHGENRK